MSQQPFLSEEQWKFYDENGYVKLGKLLSDDEVKQLCQRIDDIMLGKADLDYNKMLMQLDGDTGKYEDAGTQSTGHKGATLGYRKIQQLEFDPLFLEYMQRPIYKSICDRVYGAETPIAAMRAMFFNKPANKGTFLPFHQDRWTMFEGHDPLVTVWTALDPATVANGCVQIVPGSHKLGVINPSHGSGFLKQEMVDNHVKPDNIFHLELAPGEVALLHNYTIHGSDVNRSSISRRAFSVCYMDARHQGNSGEKFTTIFGEGALKDSDLTKKRETALA
jgi:phytanoyl-CoA hydroxylase